MNLALVTETYPPEINGVALTVQSMTQCSLRLGHQVMLVHPRQPGVKAIDVSGLEDHVVPGLPVPRYPGLRFGLPAGRRLTRLFKDRGIGALYVATEGPLGWSALRAARSLGIPSLTGFHTRFDQYAGHYGVPLARSGVSAYMRRFHNASDGTLVPTRELKSDLEAQGYRHVRILERAVDTRLFSPRNRCARLRSEWGLQEDDLAVLHVGRLAPEKNLGLAIKAYQRIQQDHPSARFILVGDGPSRERLMQEHPDFVFAGLKRGQDLSSHYASADLFVFPSLSETFGNVVLEALSSGLPVMAYDCAAAADFVAPGENGFLAPPGDERNFIRGARVLANVAREVPDLHRNARLSVRHLQPNRVAQRLCELFGELISLDQESPA